MFTTAQAVTLAGITYRKIDYWTRIGLVVPVGGPVAAMPGSGVSRQWDINELFVICVVTALMELKAGTDIAGRVAEWLRMTNAEDPIERRIHRTKLYVDVEGFVLDDPAVALCYCIDLDVIRAKFDQRAADLAAA